MLWKPGQFNRVNLGRPPGFWGRGSGPGTDYLLVDLEILVLLVLLFTFNISLSYKFYQRIVLNNTPNHPTIKILCLWLLIFSLSHCLCPSSLWKMCFAPAWWRSCRAAWNGSERAAAAPGRTQAPDTHLLLLQVPSEDPGLGCHSFGICFCFTLLPLQHLPKHHHHRQVLALCQSRGFLP